MSAGVLAQQNGYSGLKFFQLDSTDNLQDIKQWTIDDIGFVIRSFAMDVAQDLLVAIELRYVTIYEAPASLYIHIYQKT